MTIPLIIETAAVAAYQIHFLRVWAFNDLFAIATFLWTDCASTAFPFS
jgi:hypothetical protein